MIAVDTGATSLEGKFGGVMLTATLPLYQKSWALNAALAEITDPVAFRALDVSAEMYW
jgi:hypothetical protein